MSRILITGGAGFIGSALVRRMLADGHQVLNVDKLTYASHLETLNDVSGKAGYSFQHADVANGPAMAAAIAKFKPDAIFHLAAETHVDRSIDDAAVFIETNIRGTYVMLEAALRLWSGLDGKAKKSFRFVHVSTDEVYGSLGESGAFTEDDPYRPNSPYAASKAAADHLVHAWFTTYGLPAIITNCSNNYGPYQHPEKLIPTVLRHALAGEVIPVYGDGKNCRDWLHVDDHVEGLILALDRARPGEKYLFGTHRDKTNIEFVKQICAILDQASPRTDGQSYAEQITLVADRPGHDFRYAINPAKAEAELNWKARHSLASGLEETVAWYIANPDWMARPKAELGRLGLGKPQAS